MSDLIVGFGIFLVIEGVIWALMPGLGEAVVKMAAETPQQTLRLAGVASVALGVALVWLVRG